jgi:Uncharacterized conserved protein (DUF2183)
MKSIFAFLFLFSLLSSSGFSGNAHALVSREEKVTFYSTYGYQDGDNWVIPMRVWVRERRGLSERLSTKVAASLGRLELGDIGNFRSRFQDFVADDESREEVTFAFDNDPANQKYSVQDSRGTALKTDHNGLAQGEIRIPLTKATELLRRQSSRDGWLTYRATSRGHSGTGRVRLIEPTGLSVISDIDDTIKVTEIPAGSKVVVKNTFFRDFVAAPGMAEMYQGLNASPFHYVSGGPWQLYEPLSQFLSSERAGFPEGSFHMRTVRKNLVSADTWEDLEDLVTNKNATMELKLSYIREIMQRFKDRHFILIGDSGEKDPEVYRQIKDQFKERVREIRIRDIVNDREKNPSRLEGMTIIEAPTVVKGVSQFGS